MVKLTPEHCTALRRRLCPPRADRPYPAYVKCPCCGSYAGAYWVYPSWWTVAQPEKRPDE